MKTLILTGASRGIGLATVKHFLAQGWRVLTLGRQPSAQGSTHFFIDLGAPDWELQLKPFLSQLSPTSICLVNNAAYYVADSIMDVEAEHLDKSLHLNVQVPALLSQALLPLMLPGSSIIHIGSTLSEKGVQNNVSYTVSKHAILGLMRAMTQDLMGKQIYTMCLCPGATDTEMLKDRCQHDPAILNKIQALNTEKRFITPAEIAELVFFCAINPVLNGSVLHANFGQRST